MIDEIQEFMNTIDELERDLKFAYDELEELKEENEKLKLKLEQKSQVLYTPFELLEKEGFNYVNTYDNNSFILSSTLLNYCTTTSVQMFVKPVTYDERIHIYLDVDNPFIYYQTFEYSTSISEDLSKNPLFQKYERVTINDKPYYYEKTKGAIIN